jgi:MFS family permease
MGRRSALVLLGVVGAGAFLSGLELMITAVALPAIVVDLADWTQLRPASWIINGYLLVSIVVMPIAGQLADRSGVRRVFLWALVIFIGGSVLAGRATGLGDLIAARLV